MLDVFEVQTGSEIGAETAPKRVRGGDASRANTLQQRLQMVEDASGLPRSLVADFGAWVSSAPDEQVFRVNVVRWAGRCPCTEQQAIDLFLHAAHVGILDMSWGVVCPMCAMLITTPGGMRALTPKSNCKLCRVEVDGALDDAVEVTFSVAPTIRALRFHDASRVSLARDAQYLFYSPSAEPTPFRAWLLSTLFCELNLPPHAAGVLAFDGRRPGWYAVFSPAVHALAFLVSRPGIAGADGLAIDVLDGSMVPAEASIGTGEIRLNLRNLTGSMQPIGVMFLGGDHDVHEAPSQFKMVPYLTGKRLLTSQTFRDLFRAESIRSESGLEIKSLSILFTDLFASTAMYERLGDLRALELVRRHFELLRSVVVAEHGAVVKTIGDAVMASFTEPDRAIAAALRMIDEIRALHEAGEELVLKIGVHSGPCVAIQSNNQIDYFGRTVNIAARVQAAAAAGEIVCTEAVWNHPGVAATVSRAAYTMVEDRARLKGFADEFRICRLRTA